MKVKDLKLENLIPAKDGFITLERGLALKNVKIRGEASSAHREGADKYPDTIMKITEKKEYWPEKFLTQMKVSYSGAGRGRRGSYIRHLLIRQRSKHQI